MGKVYGRDRTHGLTPLEPYDITAMLRLVRYDVAVEFVSLAAEGQKIRAIKLYRQECPAPQSGLKESVEMYDGVLKLIEEGRHGVDLLRILNLEESQFSIYVRELEGRHEGTT